MPRRNRNASPAVVMGPNVTPLALRLGAYVKRLRFVNGALCWVLMPPPGVAAGQQS